MFQTDHNGTHISDTINQPILFIGDALHVLPVDGLGLVLKESVPGEDNDSSLGDQDGIKIVIEDTHHKEHIDQQPRYSEYE